ncbi:MAG TPA: TIM barrel protein [Symbiobacteriaceae bacterium]
MALLFVPLTGAFQQAAGSGLSTLGENLDRPHWSGAELSGLDSLRDVWGAVSEAEFHDWILGVRHPLYIKEGPAPCRFLDRDPAERKLALDIATTAAEAAHHLGARYIVFPFPFPGPVGAGAEGGAHQPPDAGGPDGLADWTEEAVYEASRQAFAHLAELQERERIQIALELSGLTRHFLDGDILSRLFGEFPDLSLCIDTGRLGLLARSWGQDPLELTKRWLPWTRYLHLHTSLWEEDGSYRDRIPTNGTHSTALWPRVTPAADIARLVTEAQPRCSVVLWHDPRAVTAGELEEAHRWAAAMAVRKEAG